MTSFTPFFLYKIFKIIMISILLINMTVSMVYHVEEHCGLEVWWPSWAARPTAQRWTPAWQHTWEIFSNLSFFSLPTFRFISFHPLVVLFLFQPFVVFLFQPVFRPLSNFLLGWACHQAGRWWALWSDSWETRQAGEQNVHFHHWSLQW